MVYGAEHGQLRAAGVPVLPLHTVPADLRPTAAMTEVDAQRVAAGLAGHRGAQASYRCRFAGNVLFLAVFDLEIFPASDDPGR